MRLQRLITICLSLVSASTSARADEARSTLPPGLTPALPTATIEQPAYGLQTLAVDISGVTLLFAGGGTLGLATYIVGAPILHAVHGHPGRAVASLLLRAVVPMTFGIVGARLTDDGEDGFIVGALFGLGAGVVTTSAIDIGYLSRGDEAPSRIAPSVAPVRGGGMTFGLAGTF